MKLLLFALLVALSGCSANNQTSYSSQCAETAKRKEVYSKTSDQTTYSLCMDAAQKRQQETRTEETTFAILDFLVEVFDNKSRKN